MRLILLAAAALVAATPVAAQTAAPAPGPVLATPAADPADVSDIGSILQALYASISGDAGQARDWDRFLSLMHPSALLIPSGVNAQGAGRIRFLTPAAYMELAGPGLMEGFHEVEIARHVDQYGRIAQVFSTYETRKASTDAEPFMRGINSIQLWNDGTRWWVLTIYWQAETLDTPIPPTWLPQG